MIVKLAGMVEGPPTPLNVSTLAPFIVPRVLVNNTGNFTPFNICT